jgi:hypothetical protein
MNDDYLPYLLNKLHSCPIPFLRDTSLVIKEKGYMDLSTFFDSLTDIQLETLLAVFQQSSELTEEGQAYYETSCLVTVLLSVGSGVYYDSVDDAQESVLVVYAYVLLEYKARKFMSDKALRELRSKYDIQKYPDFLGMNA